MAQTEAIVIAVVNHADWCPSCKNNGERAPAAFKTNNTDGAIKFVVNNLTNDETKSTSLKELTNLGLDKAMATNKGTGIVYFFDANNKKFISSVSVAKSNREFAEALTTVKNGAN